MRGTSTKPAPCFTTPGETSVESYLRSVGLERAATAAQDNQARASALNEVWATFDDPQVESIAASIDIFDPPATRSAVALAIAQLMRDSEAYDDALRFLNDVVRGGTDDPEIIRMQAEIMGNAGSRSDALQELEKLATRQEGAHQYGPANETLTSMLRLVPGNIRLRARIVENALRTGNFDLAIDQLVMQGRLLHRAGRVTEAEPPIHRAIEIATMANDWETVNKLHRLLINFDPDDTRLRHAAVTTYVQYGRTSDAMKQLREIVRIAQKRNEPDEAIAASHQMLALDPNDPSTYHQLGVLLISIQEYSQADRVYRRLANITPDDPAVKAKRSAIAALSRAR
jgi:tetratricopeptide (TPR) repeat protein